MLLAGVTLPNPIGVDVAETVIATLSEGVGGITWTPRQFLEGTSTATVRMYQVKLQFANLTLSEKQAIETAWLLAVKNFVTLNITELAWYAYPLGTSGATVTWPVLLPVISGATVPPETNLIFKYDQGQTIRSGTYYGPLVYSADVALLLREVISSGE